MIGMEQSEITGCLIGFAHARGERAMVARLSQLDPAERLRALSTQPYIADLLDEAAAIYAVAIDDILSPAKPTRIVRARQWVMYHAALAGRMSLPDIARRLQRKDHATVIHGVRVHALRHGLPLMSVPRDLASLPPVIFEGPEPTRDRPWDPATAIFMPGRGLG
ncbi:helix-turn-helix domain-containing protein [Maricaulis maris]|uniref:DnaA-like protein n=1 Tax=Maricaulis maris TaxID=74318 RepID=A0A495D1M6_9PROT|nr:helix-turn-helix domain-containing protein [Maricaulis maris]RKQ95444.1 DnaA-like protein [Maricaulis maris]